MNKRTEETLRALIEKTVLLKPALLLNRRRHAFYGLRTIGLPHRIAIELTDRCNLSCVECAHGTRETRQTHDLAPELFRNFIDEYAGLIHASGASQKNFDIMFDGIGEPSLSPHLAESISYLHDKLPDARAILFTNGVELNEPLARLLVGRVKLIIFNINGTTSDSYSAKTGKDMYSQVRRNILRFIDIRKEINAPNDTSITLQLTRHDDNVSSFDRFRADWQSGINDGDELIIKATLHNWGGRVKVNGLADTPLTKRRQPCYHPWQTTNITSTGELLACPLAVDTAPESLLHIGTLRVGTSFKRLYRSSQKLTVLKKLHLCGRCDFGSEPCQNCSLPYDLRSPFFKWPKPLGSRWF